MEAWGIVFLVFVAGCIGGLTNAAISGELHLPNTDRDAKIYRPGWIGNVLVGGVAALVFWGMYGPMAATVLVGANDASNASPTLRVSELFAALLTGVGGGRLLTAEVEKRFARKETEVLTETKDTLASAVQELAEQVKDGTT